MKRRTRKYRIIHQTIPRAAHLRTQNQLPLRPIPMPIISRRLFPYGNNTRKRASSARIIPNMKRIVYSSFTAQTRMAVRIELPTLPTTRRNFFVFTSSLVDVTGKLSKPKTVPTKKFLTLPSYIFDQ